jgi:hypothetical protein
VATAVVPAAARSSLRVGPANRSQYRRRRAG